MKKGYLVLQNGQVFEGIRFGATEDAVGELIFNTGMGGYMGTLTDPANEGQIVMQTYPLIGNCGVIWEDFEHAFCHVSGYVVRECCDAPSNFRTNMELDEYLQMQGVPGLYGVDTRQLTRVIRENGVMNAMICDEVPTDLTVLETYAITGKVEEVTRGGTIVFPAENAGFYRVTLIDYGVRNSLVRWLRNHNCNVTVVPATTPAAEILAAMPHGVVLSGGPGNPAENTAMIEQIGELLGKVPLLGVGLGHQMVALAAGGTVSKLKYGHHGANQPVRDLNGTRTYITSQNHGYAVDADSVKTGRVSYVNANDDTCEGMDYPEQKAFTVQFHPESCTGPKDTSPIFERFERLMKGGAL